MARRRGQNEGSTFKRTDGRWCAVLNLGWENGRRKRKYLYGGTAEAVQDALLKARGDVKAGLPVAVERQSVALFLDLWLEHSVKSSVRALTYEQYAQHVRLYISPALGPIRLAKLNAQHVRSFLGERLKAGLSPRTVQITLVVLRLALDQAVNDGLVPRNVARLVDPPRWKRPEIRPLSPEQSRRLLDAAKGERLEALYSAALALGLRRGEALGLRWQDLNFDSRTLSIAQAVARVGGKRFGQPGKLEFVEPKSRRSRRTIPMPESVASALRAHRIRQIEERLAAGPEWREHGLAFTTRIGTPMEPRGLVEDFKRLLKKAGLPAESRFHDLRHSAASLLLAQGVHPRTVMELLGHSQISLTMDTYSHVLPEVMRDATDRIEAVLGGRN